MKCPNCGTDINPKAMMCIHCGIIFKVKNGKVHVTGNAKIEEAKKRATVVALTAANGAFVQGEETIRQVEADKVEKDLNPYMEKDAISTGNLNPLYAEKLSDFKKSTDIIKAKDMKIDKTLLDLYIGDRGQDILHNMMNWSAFLIGPVWFFFRKQYLLALLYTLIYVGIVYATSFIHLPLIVVLIVLGCFNLFCANFIYIISVKMNLLFYRVIHGKMEADIFMTKVETLGGVSYLGGMIGAITILILIITYYVIL